MSSEKRTPVRRGRGPEKDPAGQDRDSPKVGDLPPEIGDLVVWLDLSVQVLGRAYDHAGREGELGVAADLERLLWDLSEVHAEVCDRRLLPGS